MVKEELSLLWVCIRYEKNCIMITSIKLYITVINYHYGKFPQSRRKVTKRLLSYNNISLQTLTLSLSECRLSLTIASAAHSSSFLRILSSISWCCCCNLWVLLSAERASSHCWSHWPVISVNLRSKTSQTWNIDISVFAMWTGKIFLWLYYPVNNI